MVTFAFISNHGGVVAIVPTFVQMAHDVTPADVNAANGQPCHAPSPSLVALAVVAVRACAHAL